MHRDAYHAPGYNETQLRREFLDPFFEALGWDVDNKQNFHEAYKEVIHEDSIKIGEWTKAPDYCFRIGGVRKFFVEAKKPAVNIKDDVGSAYQVRRYAWSAKLPLSILTNFEGLAVYDCRQRPNPTDKASVGRVLYIPFTEFVSRWDEIASVFSRDAIPRGAFDKFADSNKAKRGTSEVDDTFLGDIEAWRKSLAGNLALRNPDLTQRDLNFAVQRTIDRIIFLRICEDRGIEQYGTLQTLLNGPNVYPRLAQLFHAADRRYNSGLFHFQKENDRAEPPDDLTLALTIDDKALKEIVKNLYYPECPYAFSVLGADILGHIYEQFLGKVIRLTAGHHAVVEDKPEVKKAGGVYYTPTYIVDYIVKNTVGKLLDGKTPQEISGKGRAAFSILDPACGSGSFLIGAYQYLLDWHLDWYFHNDPEKWCAGKNPALVKAGADVGDRAYRLSTAERKRILTSHIYGVDIDAQAVETTKLSLLLKVLEGENDTTIKSQLTFFHERALPDLGANIKCGNSLIGPDFYDGANLSLFDEDVKQRINAFNWKTEFPGIMRSGGFYAVVGNPPYVRQELLGESKEYFHSHYKAYHGTADLYTYFIERGVSLLRQSGLFGIIVANKWMRANYGEPLREWMRGQHIVEITDFGDLPVFKTATTYPCILLLKRNEPQSTFAATNVASLEFESLAEYVKEHQFRVAASSLGDNGWTLTDEQTDKLLKKLRAAGTPLGDYVQGKIYYGIKTGLNEAFVIDGATRERLILEDAKSAELIRPFLIGREVKKYGQLTANSFLISIPKGWTNVNAERSKNPWEWLKKEYPAIASHLSVFEHAAKARSDQGDYWWELRACDYYDAFERSKIIYPNICRQPEFAWDEAGLYTNQKCFIIPTADKFLLGVLNSSVCAFLFRELLPKLRGGFFEPSYVYFKTFPIPPRGPGAVKIENLVNQMLALNAKLATGGNSDTKTRLMREASVLMETIDAIVYELYGLDAEEIRVIKCEK